MLDVMRRNIKSLAFTLWLVIGSFIFFIFVQWGMGRAERTGGKAVLAQINDEPIYADQYRESFQGQLRRMKDMFRQPLDRQMIRQLGLENSVIESLIAEELLVQEAGRLGIKISDDDLREAILKDPSFQENGKFIGREKYERLLQMNRRTPPQYEAELRRQLLIDKLRKTVTLPLMVSDLEARESYYRTNEKAKASYMVVKSVTDLVPNLADAELKAYFEKNRARFEMPERRKGRYIFLDIDRLRQQVNLTPRDIESYYNEHIEQFTVEEQVEGQKIVISWESQPKEEAKKLADSIVARARKGEDFAKLAKENSKDPTAANGGETGPITRGSLGDVEETVVFSQTLGTISDPIETETAWMIYKVNSGTAATQRSLPEADPQIRTILSWQKARQAMDRKISEVLQNARDAKSLDKAAESGGLVVKETPLLAKGDETPGLNDAGQLSESLFVINKGDIDGPLSLGNGALVYTVTAVEPPRPSKYEEVTEKVRKALSDEKRIEEAAVRARQALAELQSGAKPEDVAKRAGTTLKEQEFSRDSYIEDIGPTSYIEEKAFGAESRPTWIGPIPVRGGVCLIRVIEKKPVLDADFEKEKENTRETLLQEKRSRFFESYLQLLRKKNRVYVSADVLSEVNDVLLSSFS